MTKFNIDKFRWDGMYLMYEGEQPLTGVYYFSNMAGGCHPTRHATRKPMFIARFKYGSKPWKTWAKAFAKHYTVEQVVEAYAAGKSPLDLFQATKATRAA